MSADATTAGGFFERSPERAYFQALEAVMIKHRGAPFQLSPDDWHLSKHWLAEGIPLDLVDEAIGAVVERRREKDREIPRRLTFYRQAVEVAWKRVGALSAPGIRREAPAFDLEGRLRNLASAVEKAGAGRPAIVALARRITDAARDAAGDLESVEAVLGTLDGELLAAAQSDLEPQVAGEIDRAVARSMQTHADRSPEPPSADLARRIRATVVRETLSLPVLSLFSPEAADEGGEPSDAP